MLIRYHIVYKSLNDDLMIINFKLNGSGWQLIAVTRPPAKFCRNCTRPGKTLSLSLYYKSKWRISWLMLFFIHWINFSIIEFYKLFM